MSKQTIAVSCRIFDDQFAQLDQMYDVKGNQQNTLWNADCLCNYLKEAQGALISLSDHIDEALLEQCSKLRVICNIAVGYNNIDVAACRERNIVCTNTPGVLTQSTADLGFALMMAAARRVAESERYLRAGQWKQPLALDAFTGTDLYGATLGIVGMGRIGQAIAHRGVFGFDMQLLYHNRSRLDASLEQNLKAQYVSLDDLLKRADHVVLVLPFTPEVYHLIGARELALMKSTATLTNIARGGIIDENALADALAKGQIAAAALDVYEGEPKVNPRLLKQSQLVTTPHIGSASLPTRRAMCTLAIDNLNSVLAGREALTPVRA